MFVWINNIRLHKKASLRNFLKRLLLFKKNSYWLQKSDTNKNKWTFKEPRIWLFNNLTTSWRLYRSTAPLSAVAASCIFDDFERVSDRGKHIDSDELKSQRSSATRRLWIYVISRKFAWKYFHCFHKVTIRPVQLHSTNKVKWNRTFGVNLINHAFRACRNARGNPILARPTASPSQPLNSNTHSHENQK